MPEMLFKRIKDWATSIEEFRTGDVMPVDGPSGTAKITFSNLTTWIHNKWAAFVSACTAITSFASGDVIAVSNTTNGARKMSKDTLLELTAQNALGSIKSLDTTKYKGFMALDDADGTGKMDVDTIFNNFAPRFIPYSELNPTTTIEGYPYMYDGSLYVAKVSGYQGSWDASKFTKIDMSEMLAKISVLAEANKRFVDNTIDSPNMLPRYKADIVDLFGVSCTYEDGVVMLSGTASQTGGRTTKFCPSFYLDAGTYTISRSNDKSNVILTKDSDDTAICIVGVPGVLHNTFTLNTRTLVYVGINVINATTYSGEQNIQLEKGSNVSAFHKTTEGIVVDETARENNTKNAEGIRDIGEIVGSFTRPSKNLLPIYEGVRTVYDVDITYKDGLVSFSGTANASGGRTYAVAPAITLKAGTYTVSRSTTTPPLYVEKVVDNSIVCNVDGVGQTFGTFTLYEETDLYIGYNLTSGVDYSGKTSLVQIENGALASKWVSATAYTLDEDGIENNERVIDNSSSVKNILPVQDVTTEVYGVSVNYKDGVVTMDGTATFSGGRTIPITDHFTIPAGAYTFSRFSLTTPFFIQDASDDSILFAVYQNQEYTNTVLLESDVEAYVGVNVVNGTTYSHSVPKNIQLEIGSTATSFVKASERDFIDSTARSRLTTAEENITTLQNDVAGKLNKPSDNGTDGQILKTKGDGTTEWTNVGLPTEEEIAQAISDWLDAHPEATTTVEDWSLSYEKLEKGTLGFVTPEMYGAVGDGVVDDTAAFHSALATGLPVMLSATYLLATHNTTHNGLSFVDDLPDGTIIFGRGTIKFPANAYTLVDPQYTYGLNLFYVNGKCTIRGITVDMNGANNIVPSGKKLTMYVMYGNLSNSYFDGVTFKNCAGRNMLSIQGGDNNKFNCCDFILGGTNYQSNVNQDDFSFVYCLATNTTFEGCNVDGIYEPITIGSGGIELHGSGSKVVCSTIKKVCDGVILACNDALNPLVGCAVSNNRIEARRGIVFWFTNAFRDIVISGNSIRSRKIGDMTETAGITIMENTDDNSKPDVKNLSITNNIIVGDDVTLGYMVELHNVNGLVMVGNSIKSQMYGVHAVGDKCLVTNNYMESKSLTIQVSSIVQVVNNNMVVIVE